MTYTKILLLSIFLFLFSYGGGSALVSREILVVANRNVPGSVELGKFYIKQRKIPDTHLCTIDTTQREWCSRKVFEAEILSPLQKDFKERSLNGKIQCIVLMYGIPLRVNPPEMTDDQKALYRELKKKRYEMGKDLEKLSKEDSDEKTKMQQKRTAMYKNMMALSKKDYRASVDSELSLVLEEFYDLKGWLRNPYYLGFKSQVNKIKKENVLFISRLDGPDVESVKRIINESIETERNGLKGKGYFDARYPKPSKKIQNASQWYDFSIHKAAERVEKEKISVVLNDVNALFQPGECPNAALYCGWYSHHNYIDAFEWQPGSVGYHIASSECSTLKNKKSKVWCKRMIEEGIAATLGPVGEPYLQAFPVPEVFFGLLVEGRLSLVECYMLSLPFLSWQMVLVGDPLYTPFATE